MATRTLTAVFLTSVVAGACNSRYDGYNGAAPTPIAIVVSGVVTSNAGEPLAGVTVTGIAGTALVRSVTDDGGAFELPSIEILYGGRIRVMAQKDGYLAGTAFTSPKADRASVEVKLTAIIPLPMEGSVSAELSSSDPADMESERLYNAKFFSYSLPGSGTTVELSVQQTGNANLKFWIVDDSGGAGPIGPGQVVELSGIGTLVVGQTGTGLAQPVPFTLTMKRGG